MQPVFFPYFVYLMFFLSIGMLSGSIVHMPLNPGRYSIIMSIALVVFVTASYLNEVKIDKKNMTPWETAKFLFFSLILSIGIGMISGGIQHFDEEPLYASYLIPFGLVLSFISYVLKNKIALPWKRFAAAFAVILVLAAGIGTGLNQLAHSPGMVSEQGHDEEDKH
ncbi:hypothetical protein [Carboxydocella sp. ULO1]|uniref:hypothetical protein n=1 Tax=Carboxydocella sp. ULO1 TaxID=1926599 RepID=UPI0009ADCB0A|nr:hypothetical protein [Carboxydocella sp. ULO1]GAW28519.1 hypothetical protein ULO1_10890 [Carboxydocella sp. ULO1]